jgi:hypothetical protein
MWFWAIIYIILSLPFAWIYNILTSGEVKNLLITMVLLPLPAAFVFLVITARVKNWFGPRDYRAKKKFTITAIIVATAILMPLISSLSSIILDYIGYENLSAFVFAHRYDSIPLYFIKLGIFYFAFVKIKQLFNQKQRKRF